MPSTIQFYHLLSTPCAQAVPKLMQRALDAKHRVLIWCADASQQAQISDALWSANPASFLPHGAVSDAHAQLQPIVLNTEEAAPNNADLLVITHAAQPKDANAYSKVLDIFDGHDDAAVLAARVRWGHYKAQGHPLQYIKQQPGGGWKIESETASSETDNASPQTAQSAA